MSHSNVRVYLSIGSLLIAAGMITGFYFVEIPTENMRLLDTALGFAAGFVTTSFGYYFGASSQSKTGEQSNDKSNES